MTRPEKPGAGLPLYLGPTLPRWQPRSAADIQAAIDDGTLTEHHWVDVKGEVKASDGANKELARDMASFANDGGCLLIGVSEDKPTQTFRLAPVTLAGLSERVDQVARSRCDPPLYVACHPLKLDDNPEQGVLLVEIPPSPLAPHMVEGAYWGRNDTTKHKLTDNEVARLHAVRVSRHRAAEQIIQREIDRDPTPASMRELSHLFVVAEPLASPPELLTPLIGTPRLNEIVQGIPRQLPPPNATPTWEFLSTSEPRAAGWGWHSSQLAGRRVNSDPDLGEVREKQLLDLEISDDGSIVLFVARASDGGNQEQFIVDALVVAFTRCVLALAAELGVASGYSGRWLLAVGITDLAGKRSAQVIDPFPHGIFLTRFSDRNYVQGTEAMTKELLDQPGAVTRRLLHRLLRALRVDRGEDNPMLTDQRG